MMFVRPAVPDDLEAIARLASHTGFGLTTLPKDVEVLAKRLSRTVADFKASAEEPGGENYLFVLEDAETGAIGGTSSVISRVGGFEPFYMFRIEKVKHASSVLDVEKEVRVLHLVEQHDGPCEIATLFLSPEFRGAGLGRLLSKARFLFLAAYRRAFADFVIAEMRGVADDSGRSPFWESVGRHFFEVDFPKADCLSASDKKFIAELMPKYPIYIDLLPFEAQAVIGKVNNDSRPALKILATEGFRPTGMVDIFDGGPILGCPLDKIQTAKASSQAQVAEIQGELTASTSRHLIAATPETRSQFRACLGCVQELEQGRIGVDAASAAALSLRLQDTVRYVSLHP